MRIKTIIFSVILLMFLLISIGTLNNFSGYKVDEWKEIETRENIDFPFYKIIEEKDILKIKNNIDFKDNDLFVIPKIDGGAMQVFIDSNLIYETGDVNNRTGNIWNYKHIVKIPGRYLDNESYDVEIKLFGLYDYGISAAPFLTKQEESLLIFGLSNFFNNGFFYVAFGSSIILSFIIVILGVSNREFRESYFYLGLAIFFTGIYMLDFVYRPTSGTIFNFLLFKKIVMISAYLASIFIVKGIIKFHNEKSKFVNILFFITISIVVIFSSISDPYYYKLAYLNGNYILLINVFVAEYYLLKFKDKYLLAPLTFSFVTMVHAILNSIFMFHHQYYVNYGLIIGVIGVGLSLIDRYVQMYENTKRSLKKARTDKLTGLYNRNVIEEIDLSYKNVIFADLDNFKIANDVLGHEFGDKMLKDISNLFLENFENETIIRFGGDEFLIFSKFDKQEKLVQKMNSIRKKFKKKIGDTNLSVSYGISKIDKDIELSIRFADSKMYLMKNKDD
ncbi:MAG: GGDEF domain-containing protein [Thermotogota bacterium]